MYLFRLNLKESIVALLFFKFSIFSFAEPFLAPTDPFTRHEIRLLGDEGGFDGLQNSWPMDLGRLSSDYRNLLTTVNFSTIVFQKSQIQDFLPFTQLSGLPMIG